jgi:hypothetical protein
MDCSVQWNCYGGHKAVVSWNAGTVVRTSPCLESRRFFRVLGRVPHASTRNRKISRISMTLTLHKSKKINLPSDSQIRTSFEFLHFDLNFLRNNMQNVTSLAPQSIHDSTQDKYTCTSYCSATFS